MDFGMEHFKAQVNKYRDFIDEQLQETLESVNTYPPTIHEAMRYSVFNGGKRLRPMLVFEGAKLAGGNPDEVIPAACAMELIHCYSLVHDDLPAMDDDDLRRGKPTCHIIYGEAIAILAGDALLTRAFELLALSSNLQQIDPARVVQVISEVSKAVGSCGMIGGQVVDLQSEGRQIDCSTLETLHSLKTGQLFRVSLRSGAIIAGMDNKTLAILDNYCYHFGLAFQISDDILDIKGNPQVIGKPVGSDFKNAKNTYPSILGLEKSYQLAQNAVEACLESLQVFGKEADFLRCLARYTLQREK